MPRHLTFAMVVGTASILFAPSCNQTCESPCDFSTMKSRFVTGTATVSLGDDPPVQIALTHSPANYAAPNHCVVASLSLTIAPNGQPSAPWGPVIMCNIAGHELRIFPHGLRDIRSLAPGMRTVGTVVGDLQSRTPGAPCLSEGGSLGTTTVDVTRAEGGLAPYPALVTPDYVRELNAHVEAQITQVTGTNCRPVTITADLTLTQSADDVEANSAPVCSCL